MTSEWPFKVAVSGDTLALLECMLHDTRLPDKVSAGDWAYGALLANISQLASRWNQGHDWHTHERDLNALSMDGFGDLSVHYVHQQRAAERTTPLLFVHGCTPIFSHSTPTSHY